MNFEFKYKDILINNSTFLLFEFIALIIGLLGFYNGQGLYGDLAKALWLQIVVIILFMIFVSIRILKYKQNKVRIVNAYLSSLLPLALLFFLINELFLPFFYFIVLLLIPMVSFFISFIITKFMDKK